MHRSIPCFMGVLGALLLPTLPVQAGTPTHISYQGWLQTSAGWPVPDGAHSLRFRLFNAPEGQLPVTDEAYTMSGNTIQLTHAPIVTNSDIVKKADGTVTYTRGTAYTIDYKKGIITRVSAGAIPDGTRLKITYAWTASVLWTETHSLPTYKGHFNAFLGQVAPLPWSQLDENTTIEVAVMDNGTTEVLSPRQTFASVPYAMRVNTLEGALGGAVNGRVNASNQVSGIGTSASIGDYSLLTPGLLGTGATSAGGDAPGVQAVGANSGTGLALKAIGSAEVTGPLTAASVTSAGLVSGTGLLRPVYDSGVLILLSGDNDMPLPLPESLGGSPSEWVVTVYRDIRIDMSYGSTYHYIYPADDQLKWNIAQSTKTATGEILSRQLYIQRRDGITGEIRFRARVWSPH